MTWQIILRMMAPIDTSHPAALGAAPPAAPSGPGALSSALIVLGIIMVVWILLRGAWRRQRDRNQKTPLEHMTEISAGAQERQREAGPGPELLEMSRRLVAQIDARAAHLEALIADADDRIEELRRLQAAGADHDGRPAGRAGAAPPSSSAASSAADPRAEDPVSRGVYELADRGLGPVEIARQLDQHVGAVELILALRQQ